MVEEGRRCEATRHVQEIEEHERWVQHQLVLRARREQLIRARREKIEEEQRLRQHAEAVRVLVRTLPFAQEFAKPVRVLQTEAEKPQSRRRPPVMKHQLTRLLEQVDAIERDGHDTVRDVRRALVQRIEGALEALDSSNAFTMEGSKEAGITIREAAREVRTLSPIPVPYDVDELLKRGPSSPEPTSSSPEPAFSAPVPEPYVADDFLVASPALKVDLDASQLLGDPTVLAQSLSVDELEVLHQGDELMTDVGAAVIPRPLNNGLEPASPFSPALFDMVNIPPVTSDATYTIAVQDDPSTPAPVQVTAVDGYPTSDSDPLVPTTTPSSPAPADVSDAPPQTPLAAAYPPRAAQLFDAPMHPAVAHLSPANRATEPSDVGSDWGSARGRESYGECAFEIL
ncbi:hypothetical protein EXIGLDRAFT_699331 [Exidia glandulosa HHB12029]|uniref:BAG domain-containing protein n=1 Tax=Exidia glandulosa HHB12029 TaxID=1314781 RepID=A0A165DY40_EXIGL|nr:hypothetical protein EXIGLDRAFT_699331 [Exidia glandulosa HHB12029]